MKDFERPDGSVDWSSYEKAQKQSGERCVECGKFMFSLSGNGGPTSCANCRNMRDPHVAHHDSRIRCPSCGLVREASHFSSKVFEEGEHSIYCPDCDHMFHVQTRVSFEFCSPARVVRS